MAKRSSICLIPLMITPELIAKPSEPTPNLNTLDNPMTPIKQSQSDQNQYRHIILKNGLQVILVQDPKAEKASAALAVGVGANDNPKGQEGLTHFLEHMLFLGTEKYPEADEYKTYINEFGGSNNAYTAANHTNYFFDVLAPGYEGALDRFSQFFIAPLFSEEYAQRERKAVHSEYIAKINDDARRSNQAFKTLFNPAHPSNHFSVGNLETLKDRPNLPLREQLLASYKTFYFAQNMTLSLVANLPLEQLESLAKKYFTAIKATTLTSTLAISKLPPLTLDNTDKLQFIRPIKDRNTLSLNFILPPQKANYKDQPTRYLSYLLGQESQGSLHSYLKSKGWARSLSAGLGADYINKQTFNIRIRLTDDGLVDIDKVILAVFANINEIKNNEINKTYIEEEKALSQLGFNYHSYIEPMQLSRTLASQLLTVPATDVLDAFQITQVADTQKIKALSALLTSDNMLVQIETKGQVPTHWGQTEPEWQLEPWYQSQYANLTFNQDFLTSLTHAPKIDALQAPEKNTYIPSSLSLINGYDEIPKQVYEAEGINFWHRSDDRFDKPKSSNYLAIRYPGASDNNQQYVLNKLWARLLNDALSEATYLPYNANLNYNIYAHINGLTLVTAGYNDKQNKYLMWLMKQINQIEPESERFELAKQQLKKDLLNSKHANAYSVALWRLSEILIEDSHTITDMLSTLDNIQYKDIIAFKNKALSQYNLVGFSNGNIEKDQTVELAQSLETLYQSSLKPSPAKQIKRQLLDSGSRQAFKVDTTSQDNAILYVLSGKLEDNFTEKAHFTLLKQAIGSRFFSQLRTEKQLGYIVSTHNLTKADVPAIGFTVQSPDHESPEIVDEIETFISQDLERICNISPDEFETIRNNILVQLKREPKELGEDTSRFWREIAKPEQNFYKREKFIAAIEGIKQSTFNDFVTQQILSGKAPSILVHNQPLIESDLKENWQEVSANSNL
ncbi:insulinase family protein [Marinomonas sp. MED121]|uniref:insulinase family protein n=1 Tax=Marinomonas sp. MED121 TaxID=314277 RepID=UPI0013EFA391|nr:insulinase family protein [Marinomonas sp. MED121]